MAGKAKAASRASDNVVDNDMYVYQQSRLEAAAANGVAGGRN